MVKVSLVKTRETWPGDLVWILWQSLRSNETHIAKKRFADSCGELQIACCTQSCSGISCCRASALWKDPQGQMGIFEVALA